MNKSLLSLNYEDHKKYINIALDLAGQSGIDVPIAALIVKDNQIISSAVNQKEKLNDPTAHAEMLAIREACKKLGKWRLDNVVIYSTLEPCPMCAGAILFSRIPLIVFSAYDTINGAFGSVIDLTKLSYFSKPKIISGIEEDKSQLLLKGFFR